MSLGQHIDERPFSFYGVTPSGFLFEVGCGTRQVDVANEASHEYHAISLLGTPSFDSVTQIIGFASLRSVRIRFYQLESSQCIASDDPRLKEK